MGGTKGTFSNQALNPVRNYGTRPWGGFGPSVFKAAASPLRDGARSVVSSRADRPPQSCDLWITDPPYADAVNYHEITEFFIAWLRKNPPDPFKEWIWDSRRVLAIKGKGGEFRKGMVAAYKAMSENMPDNGMQCVMFTHQDTGVWADMVGIFWAAGLQVISAWYIATETMGGLKKGGCAQGTVILLLKKRPKGEKSGYRQLILPLVRSEARKQIETMMNLNEAAKNKHGAPVFNDSDLQMAGYAAALKVLTSYTRIGGEDVIELALRPRAKGETTVVDEIVEQASQVANNLLVPGELKLDTWSGLSGSERFFLRMMDMESKGAKKLDNCQNFAKAFKAGDYGRLMGSMKANGARLKRVAEFESRDFSESSEIGAARLGRLILALQQPSAAPSLRRSSTKFSSTCRTFSRRGWLWRICWRSSRKNRRKKRFATPPRFWARGCGACALDNSRRRVCRRRGGGEGGGGESARLAPSLPLFFPENRAEPEKPFGRPKSGTSARAASPLGRWGDKKATAFAMAFAISASAGFLPVGRISALDFADARFAAGLDQRVGAQCQKHQGPDEAQGPLGHAPGDPRPEKQGQQVGRNHGRGGARDNGQNRAELGAQHRGGDLRFVAHLGEEKQHARREESPSFFQLLQLVVSLGALFVRSASLFFFAGAQRPQHPQAHEDEQPAHGFGHDLAADEAGKGRARDRRDQVVEKHPRQHPQRDGGLPAKPHRQHQRQQLGFVAKLREKNRPKRPHGMVDQVHCARLPQIRRRNV